MKYLFFIRKNKKTDSQQIVKMISGLLVCEGDEKKIVFIEASSNLARDYNAAMSSQTADFKIYMDDSIVIYNKEILINSSTFMRNYKASLLGLYGSEMPIHGRFWQAEQRYGCLMEREKNKQEKIRIYQNPLFYQDVHCLDGRFLMTNIDIPFDETVEDAFAGAALCCRYREKNKKIIVPIQESPWSSYETTDSYSLARHCPIEKWIVFFNRYKKIIQPLVSVIIPTYNQPGYLKLSLDSVLMQDYKNIEIIIGDDSTNNDTEVVLSPYLKKYDFIEYVHHKKPLGGFGANNTELLVNRIHGEYLKVLFHDDVLYPTAISRMMEVFVKDLDECVGIVTSSRDAIDSKGKVLGRMNPWKPNEDLYLDGKIVGRRILYELKNFIGEFSTVLFRARNFFQKNSQKYQISCYEGIKDSGNGDVASFLDMCKMGAKCVFIHDTLSAFRLLGEGSNQNTENPDVWINSLLDWQGYVTISYLYDYYISGEEERNILYEKWYAFVDCLVKKMIKKKMLDRVTNKKVSFLYDLIEAAERKNYNRMFHVSIEYIHEYQIYSQNLIKRCSKNKNGQWYRLI